MTDNAKKVADSANALSDAVKEAGGCLMVIAKVPAKDGEKVADEILATLYGKVSDITEASARMLVQESAAPFRMIFKNAQTIKAIMELTGKTQADEVEITEGDGENDNNE
ncbi:hypothetical protein [uncultured Prevotella sp.]|jgi:hypothetical protein|uniref:hypothetical protein n=1 Tax=uncultured Prevotella sp. TaxID=159272 RepID=UPI0025F7FA88|nr:hypothetical protein [uncultured Prevotella sp.]